MSVATSRSKALLEACQKLLPSHLVATSFKTSLGMAPVSGVMVQLVSTKISTQQVRYVDGELDCVDGPALEFNRPISHMNAAAKLVEVFGLEKLRVIRLTLEANAESIVTLTGQFEITEEQLTLALRALKDEYDQP